MVLVGVLLSVLLWLAERAPGPFPQIVGHNCGEAAPRSDPLEAQQCFWQAYLQCHAATLVFTFFALDEGTTTHAITVQRTNGQCALTDAVQSHTGGPVLGTEIVTTYTCSGLTQQTRGLLLTGCGREGNVYLPPRPAVQLGVVCGEVDNVNNSIYAGYDGVDGIGLETVARVEACFWQAYTTCTQPYTLVYTLESTSGPRYTLVVQRQDGACGMSVSEISTASSQDNVPPTYYPCAALTRLSNGGLVAHDCGPAGTITISPATPPSN
jgi:hypothetical protein